LAAAVIISVIALGGAIAYVAPASTSNLGGVGVTPVGGVVDANTQFALRLYSVIRDDEQGQNIFFSPFSIFLALAMTYEGARGQTASEIQSVFDFPANDSMRRSSIEAICNELNNTSADYRLNIANALWIQQDYPLLDEYLNVIKSYYAGEASNVDFERALEQTRQTINAWVENRTNNRIKDLIPEGSLDPQTLLVLTNTIYFNGTWVDQFNGDATTQQDFRVSTSQTVKVPMMTLAEEASFNYADIDNIQVLEMPYRGGNLSMLVLLPKNNDLASLENTLTLEKLYQWRNELREQPVDVYMPKFSFTREYGLSEYLAGMGMPSAFLQSTADFSGIDGTRSLFIGNVLHKAFIGVNEKGTEAAGATAVVIVGTAIHGPPPAVFRADHPFVFIIQERVTGNILFLGRVINPIE
jgi:serpin B